MPQRLRLGRAPGGGRRGGSGAPARGKLLIADLAFTRQYAAWLRQCGLADVRRRNPGWRMWFGGSWFPVQLVTAVR